MKIRLIILSIFILTTNIYSQKPVVIASASMIADIAKNIGGAKWEVKTIVPIGGDPHIYEPTPGDAKLVSEADLILVNGLTFEGWLQKLIENSGSEAPVITVTEGIEVITSEKYANATDPHAWMTATNGIIYAKNITHAFIQNDPKNQVWYEKMNNTYSQLLGEAETYIRNRVNEIPKEKRILITSHDAFRYFGKEYGIQLESILGTSTDADVQTSDVMRINQVIKKSGVPAVFIESTINPKLLQQIAKDNKVGIGGKLYSDSLGDIDGPAGTYLKMLMHNTDVIVDALTSEVKLEQTTDSESTTKNWLYFGIGLILLAGIVVVYFSLK